MKAEAGHAPPGQIELFLPAPLDGIGAAAFGPGQGIVGRGQPVTETALPQRHHGAEGIDLGFDAMQGRQFAQATEQAAQHFHGGFIVAFEQEGEFGIRQARRLFRVQALVLGHEQIGQFAQQAVAPFVAKIFPPLIEMAQADQAQATMESRCLALRLLQLFEQVAAVAQARDLVAVEQTMGSIQVALLLVEQGLHALGEVVHGLHQASQLRRARQLLLAQELVARQRVGLLAHPLQGAQQDMQQQPQQQQRDQEQQREPFQGTDQGLVQAAVEIPRMQHHAQATELAPSLHDHGRALGRFQR